MAEHVEKATVAVETDSLLNPLFKQFSHRDLCTLITTPHQFFALLNSTGRTKVHEARGRMILLRYSCLAEVLHPQTLQG